MPINEVTKRLNQAIINDKDDNDLAEIKKLIQQAKNEGLLGADTGESDKWDRPVEVVMAHGSLAVIQALAEAGVDFNLWNPTSKEPPLFKIAEREEPVEQTLAVLKFLKEKGVNFNILDGGKSRGNFFHHLVTIQKTVDVRILEQIWRYGCCLDTFDIWEKIPLEYAKQKLSENHPLISNLIELGRMQYNEETNSRLLQLQQGQRIHFDKNPVTFTFLPPPPPAPLKNAQPQDPKVGSLVSLIVNGKSNSFKLQVKNIMGNNDYSLEQKKQLFESVLAAAQSSKQNVNALHKNAYDGCVEQLQATIEALEALSEPGPQP